MTKRCEFFLEEENKDKKYPSYEEWVEGAIKTLDITTILKLINII
jgi:hypothetical protein